MLPLIRRIYAAAVDARLWTGALEHLADEFRGRVGGLQYRTGPDARIQSSRFARFDPALSGVYRTYYATRNPWTRLSQPHFHAGCIFTPDRLLPLAQLRRTEFYADILQPHGVAHCFGACVYKRGDDALSFTVVRSKALGPYGETELARVRFLLPHLRRAVQVSERLSQLEWTHTAMADGLEHLRHGLILVDRQCRVVFANQVAHAIVTQQDGLAIKKEGLVAARPTERLRLRSLLDDAVRTSAGEGTGAGGAMAITRPSMRRPFLVLVAPLGLVVDGDRPSGMATVFVADPDAQVESLEAFARRLYGLTATEARVANAFAASGNVDQVADTLAVHRETVRWHLRSLYRKTGTDRQAALLARLAGASSRFVVRAVRASDHPDVKGPTRD